MLAAIIGIGVGVIALPIAAISILMRDIQGEFGWSRTELSLTSTVTIGALVLSTPLVGWLIDRYPIQRIVGFSMVAMGGSFLLLSRSGDQIFLYLATFGIMSFLAAGASTVPYARAISFAFPHNRGKALGLAMVGNGLSGIGLPLFLVPLVNTQGWRSGFVALGLIALIATPVIFLLLRGTPSPSAVRLAAVSSPSAHLSATGLSVREAVSSKAFRILAASFLLITLACAGLQVHFISILSDNGMPAASIAWYASVVGVALTITRVGTGFLLDKFPAQLVSAILIGVGAVATGVFSLAGPWAAPLGAIAIGLTIGAEIDMVGYFTSRYFGFVSYGRVYGLLYSAILVGAALSPLLYGTVRDRLGSYDAALYTTAVLLLVSSVLLLILRRHPYSTEAETAISESKQQTVTMLP